MSHDPTETKPTIITGLLVGLLVDVGGTFGLLAADIDPWVAFFAPIIPAILAARLFGADW